MKIFLTDRVVAKLPIQEGKDYLTFDTKMPTFCVRVYKTGTKTYFLFPTVNGRRRLLKIGNIPGWSASAARSKAQELRNQVYHGGADPAAARKAERDAPTMVDLIRRFETEYMATKYSPSSVPNTRSIITRHIEPAMQHLRVKEVEFEHVGFAGSEDHEASPHAGQPRQGRAAKDVRPGDQVEVAESDRRKSRPGRDAKPGGEAEPLPQPG